MRNALLITAAIAMMMITAGAYAFCLPSDYACRVGEVQERMQRGDLYSWPYPKDELEDIQHDLEMDRMTRDMPPAWRPSWDGGEKDMSPLKGLFDDKDE